MPSKVYKETHTHDIKKGEKKEKRKKGVVKFCKREKTEEGRKKFWASLQKKKKVFETNGKKVGVRKKRKRQV